LGMQLTMYLTSNKNIIAMHLQQTVLKRPQANNT